MYIIAKIRKLVSKDIKLLLFALSTIFFLRQIFLEYTKSSDGECKPVCPQICPYYVEPFCAVPDGWCGEPKSFGNPCLLAVYNCENPNNR